MNGEDSSKTEKVSGLAASHLKHEREARAWTQGEVAEHIGTTQVNVSRWERGITFPGPYYRQKLEKLFGKTMRELGLVPQGSEALDAEISGSPERESLDAEVPTSRLFPWHLPYRRNLFFTGRTEILAHLYTVFNDGKAAALIQPQAIMGLGGIGKTQIAVEYAYRYRAHYEAVFWLTASTRDALTVDFVALATILALPEQHEQDQDIVVRAVKYWLATHTQWLLILDDVENLAVVADFLPTHLLGDVLITTRLQVLGAFAYGVEVEKMGLDEGVTFLLRRTKIMRPGISLAQVTKEHRKQATAIFTALDGLPLALDQAGAYIEETHCGLSQYLSLYGVQRKELLLRRGVFSLDHPASVVATWSLSFQQVEQESQAAADLLHLIAFLDPEAMPEEIITLGALELGSTLAEVARDPFKLNQAIGLLLRYSLIRRDSGTQLLSMHALVQEVLRDGIERNLQRLWKERALRAVNRAFPAVELKTWEKCQRCLPHVLALAASLEQDGFVFPEVSRLLTEAASYLVVHARYEQAEMLLLKALEIQRQLGGSLYPDRSRALNDLGFLYLKQSTYPEAEARLQEALEMRQQLYGYESLEVAETLNHLASLHRARGAYIKAEPFHLQALRIRETTLGLNHPLVAHSYYDLAKLYNSQEKYQEAEKLCRQALAIQEHYFGNDHPLVASTLYILARSCQGQGQLELAREMNIRALQMRENILGANHPQVAVSLNSMAELYHLEGKYGEAAPLIARSLEIYTQALGPEHPYIAYSLSNQADNYFLQGDYAQAELHYRQALAIREQKLGEQHPHTASTYDSLANVCSVLERFEEAEPWCRKALSIRKRTFGEQHPIVVQTLERYVILLKMLQREKEASELNRHMGGMQSLESS